MRLKGLGEFGLIERIRKATPKRPTVRIGIGDDAAWVLPQKRSLLFTSDILVEGIHFDRRWASFYSLGAKSLSVNLSDIAAMGGIPSYLLLSLGVPVDFKAEDIEEFYRGIRDLASRTGVALVGGDLSAADRFIISPFLVGQAPHGAISRSGARIGDDLYVTGTLGDSALGLEILKRKKNTAAKKKDISYLTKRHCFPTPRLKAGALLAKRKLAKAMIDISDGLLQDLGHLCRASRVGAMIWEEALPLSPAYQALKGNRGSVPALTGGEDYELLFSSRREDRSHVERLQKELSVPITRIGSCLPVAKGIMVINWKGGTRKFPKAGYDHFRSAR